jgi:hypothetical protein
LVQKGLSGSESGFARPFAPETSTSAEPVVVVANQRQVDCQALLGRRRGKPPRDPGPMGCVGPLRADRGQVIVAVRLQDVRQEFSACAHTGHPAPPQDGKVVRVDLVVCGLAPMARLPVEGRPKDNGHPCLGPEVGGPIPRAQACDGADDLTARGRHGVEKGCRARLHLAVHQKLAGVVEETDVHGAGMQVEATRIVVWLGVEPPAVSAS